MSRRVREPGAGPSSQERHWTSCHRPGSLKPLCSPSGQNITLELPTSAKLNACCCLNLLWRPRDTGCSHHLTRIDSAKSLLFCIPSLHPSPAFVADNDYRKYILNKTLHLFQVKQSCKPLRKKAIFDGWLCVTTERNLKSPRTSPLIRHNQAVEIMENRSVSSRMYFPFRLAKSISENPRRKWVITGNIYWVYIFLCTMFPFIWR